MEFEEFLSEWQNDSPFLEVKTSGSTGKPKLLMVEKCRMRASAKNTCSFLGLTSKDIALLCMPLDYIAGKMMVVRSLETKMKLINVKPSSHPLASFVGKSVLPTFAAMVPSQVYNSLKVPAEKEILKKISHIIIGGGAIDENLEDELKDFPNSIWSSYGMTETLSHIALRSISGPNSSLWYRPFEGVSLRQTEDGCLIIDAPKIATETLVTNDIVEFNEDGSRFKIIGRKDNVIISGGIKFHIEEIEKKIDLYLKQNLGVEEQFSFMITSRKNPEFGEVIVMLYERKLQFYNNSAEETVDEKSQDEQLKSEIEESIKKALTKYERPKLYIAVDKLPKTETGKPDRGTARLLAKSDREIL